MHDALRGELATYEKRTPKSAAAYQRALERIPLGVASNYRHYEPYPIFVRDGKGSRIHDIEATSTLTTTSASAHSWPAIATPPSSRPSSRNFMRAPRSACRTTRNGNLPKKSANAIPWKWFASARAARK